jgi:hypothetical protein
MRLSSSRVRRALVGCVAGWLCASAVHANPPDGPPPGADVRALVRVTLASGDHRQRPFAVVDKRAARLHVFDADGRELAQTPVLLGAARGDHSVPGVGDRAPKDIAPHERTTPAGRFVAEPGHNLDGEHVLWFDYVAGLAIHRLRPSAAYAARSERLAGLNARDKRVSLGCVVVPGAFYDSVVVPLLAARRGAVVYVLPETVPAAQMFAGLGAD